MAPKKKSGVPSGMVKIEEPQNVIMTSKPSARKPATKAKKPSARARQIIKVKIVSPNSVAKKKEAKRKLAKSKRNGVIKRKATSQPLKIKKMLTTQEKIAFANQVAKAQLVKGAPILEEPLYMPMEPPAAEKPSVKSVQKKVMRKPRHWKKRASKKTNVSSLAVEPASSDDVPQTNIVFKEKVAPKKRLVRKQAQPEIGQEIGVAEVAVSGTLKDNPTPNKKRRGRPKKLQLNTESVPVSPQTRDKQFNELAKSTDDLSETTRENARKIEENLTRPESKVSDTFSWAANISTSSRSTNTCVSIDGKLPTVEIIDYLKYPNASVKSSLTSLSRASDPMTSPKKKASGSPVKGTYAPSKRRRDNQHLENDRDQVEKKRPRKEKRSTEKRDEEKPEKKATTREKVRSIERRNKEKKEEILKLEQERLRIEGLLKQFESKFCPPQSESEKVQKKKRDKTAKPVLSSRRCDALTSAQRKQQSRSRSSSKRRLRSDNNKPKTTDVSPAEVPLSTPDAESPSPSLNLTSSTSITVSESTSATPTSNENEREKKIAEVLIRLRRTLNNVDTEFLEWLTKEVDHETDKSIPDITFKVLKHEVEAIKICHKFKKGIPDLSSSEKSIENKSPVGSVDRQPSNEPDKPESAATRSANTVQATSAATRSANTVQATSAATRSANTVQVTSAATRNANTVQATSAATRSANTVQATSAATRSATTVQATAAEPLDIPDAPAVDDKWPYDYENDKKNFEFQPDYCDDGDDVISLFAESISGFDSIRNTARPSRLPSPFEEPREPIVPIKPIVAPKENAPVPKTKTTDVQKQNADSSTYFDTSTSTVCSNKPAQTPIVIEISKKMESQSLLMADIYKNFTPRQSSVFSGYCFFNLISKCKKAACQYPHVIPEPIVIKKRLAQLSEQYFIGEYLFLRRNPSLRSRFMDLYVDECQKRDLSRFLVEMASDAVREEATAKTYMMETVLLHLNDKDLESFKDILTNPLPLYGYSLCDVFMKTIADTQNFSRFKPVFVKLTNFLVQRHRKIAPSVASQIFERICILPYEEALAQAAILLIKNTAPTIFDNSHMNKFLDRLAENNAAAHDDLVKYKLFQANFASAIGGPQPNVENVRYTSPDTTHLDGLQNKSLEDAAIIPRPIDSGLTRTITQLSVPPTPPGDGCENLAYPRPRMAPPIPPWQRDHSFRGTPRFRGNPRMKSRGAYHDYRGGFRRPGLNVYRWPADQ